LVGFLYGWTLFLTYRISLFINQQPDFVWNPLDKCYQPIIKNLQKASVATFSEWQPRSTDPVDIILAASFAHPALQQPGALVVVAVGIEMSIYPLAGSMINAQEAGTMKMVECYV
jgi:hypothetical protein